MATTRKSHFDELWRLERSHGEFAESLRRGRGCDAAAWALGVIDVLRRLLDPDDLEVFARPVADWVLPAP